MKKKAILYILISTLIFFNCKKSTEPDIDWGGADFGIFVTIGNSLTAGFSDGALYEEAQKNSFPNLIAKAAEVDNFEQPLMSGSGFSTDENRGRLSFTGETVDYLEPGTESNRSLNRPFNNLGIPTLTVKELYTAKIPSDADNNHYVDKILRDSGRTAVEEAIFLSPTIITLWAGINDVLKYATAGKVDYTNPTEFETDFNTLINYLTAGTDAPILVANLYDLTDLPYFTDIPSSLNINGNKVYFYGECSDGVRRLTDEDQVLMPGTNEYVNYVNTGIINEENALSDSLILDVSEKNEIKQALLDYNDIIVNIVNQNPQLYLVDLYNLFKDIELDGYTIGGINYTKDVFTFDENGVPGFNFVPLFSLDGLHPNQYGYTAVANTFIEKINSTFDANIPLYE